MNRTTTAFEDVEDVQHAENVVKAFRHDLKDFGDYVAYKLLVHRIAAQRRAVRKVLHVNVRAP